MNQAILLESNADNIDFMIHGIIPVNFFGMDYHKSCMYFDCHGYYDYLCDSCKP